MSLVTWIALALASSKAVTHFCLSTSEEALKVTAVRTALPKGGPQTRNNDTIDRSSSSSDYFTSTGFFVGVPM